MRNCAFLLLSIFSLCTSMFIEDLPRRPKHHVYDQKLWKDALESYSTGDEAKMNEFLLVAEESEWCLTRPLLQFLMTVEQSNDMYEVVGRMIDAGANINAKFNSGWIIDPVTLGYNFRNRISRKDIPQGHLVIRESLLSKLIRGYVYGKDFVHVQHDFCDPLQPPKHVLDLLLRRGLKRADPAAILCGIVQHMTPLLVWLFEDPSTAKLITRPSNIPFACTLEVLSTVLIKLAAKHDVFCYFKYLHGIGQRLNIRLPGGENLLMYARQIDTMSLLLKAPGMKELVNVATAKGTALHYIARSGDRGALKKLIKYGADPLIINEAGNTAAMEAAFHPNYRSMKTNIDLLLKLCPFTLNNKGQSLADLVVASCEKTREYVYVQMLRAWEASNGATGDVFRDCPPSAGINLCLDAGDDSGSMSDSDDYLSDEKGPDCHHHHGGSCIGNGQSVFEHTFTMPLHLFLQQMGIPQQGPMPPAPNNQQDPADQVHPDGDVLDGIDVSNVMFDSCSSNEAEEKKYVDEDKSA